jgi:uncharacterized iron-regulated protein
MGILYNILNKVYILCLISCVTESAPAPQKLPAQLEIAWPEIINSDVLILGEIHDNPHHHILQAKIIKALAKEKMLGAVLFEQLEPSQMSLFQGLTFRDIDRLPHILQWSKSGWPDFTLYRPVFEASIEAGVPIIAANFPREKLRQMYQKGPESVFDSKEIREVGLDKSLPQSVLKALHHEIDEGHCHMIPRDQMDRMASVQRVRDAAMAMAHKKAPKDGISVYIVGYGHARKDFGIPWYLNNLDSSLRVISIGLGEEGSKESAKNDTYDTISSDLFDLVLLTPSAKREDPCEDLARILKNQKAVTR